MIVIKFGECVVVDGIIELGLISIDELVLIGELMFVEKNIGDVVFIGIVNCNGFLIVCVMKVNEDLLFRKIIKLVEFV